MGGFEESLYHLNDKNLQSRKKHANDNKCSHTFVLIVTSFVGKLCQLTIYPCSAIDTDADVDIDTIHCST